MRREVKVGTISFINDTPNPVTVAAEAMILEPAWIVKTYVGLIATSNPDPGEKVTNFKDAQKAKNFRAMTYCHISFDEDETAKTISNVKVLDAFHDPGWTPPFSMSKFPSSLFSFDLNVYSNQWYQGEASPLSVVYTQRRHPNTTIPGVVDSEIVLVNGLIKFRAGKHTDDIGINEVKAPFHVPWVWCEMLLTYDKGKLNLYGRGSLFPTHYWYLNDKRVAKRAQKGDAGFPRARLVPTWVPRIPGVPALNMPNPTYIDVASMVIYPVLSVGAPAAGPQVALGADAKLTTPAYQHPNTVAATPIVRN